MLLSIGIICTLCIVGACILVWEKINTFENMLFASLMEESTPIVEHVEMAEESASYVETPEVPETHLTENEKARLEREISFDARIREMKEELSVRLPNVERRGTQAEVLHPGIENLPHNIIRDFGNDLPDVEYTV